ncbi:MAG: putative CXXCH cytochrome family protein [Phycisphaerales bacterium]|jgi:predicted CXXCH cytochrome family protein
MNTNSLRLWLGAIAMGAAGGGAAAQGQTVVDSLHNLSASGPGVVRASSEEQVCIFCHTPHNSSPVRSLWNRYLPVAAYSVYTSNALDASPGQPTGSSKMCLSCHDGTIALGSVLTGDQVILMAGGVTTIPPGATNLGTDLTDDHPISFAFDSSLLGKDPHLADPAGLPEAMRLDANRELQCTTCHDAHSNTFGHFLAMDNTDSAMCLSCHQISTTDIPTHQNCASCHQTHTAPSGPYLLRGDRVTTTCTECHDGAHPPAVDIATGLLRFSAHDTGPLVDSVNPIPNSVTCTDCHDPHTMMSGTAAAPAIHPSFGVIDGINASGSPVTQAAAEYEVCFKCHADESVFTASWVPRQITQTNTRLEFAPNAVSFHPVQSPGRNADVPSLRPGWTESSVMYCTDCHASDTSPTVGGLDAAGPHGSNEEPLLVARYDTDDFAQESAAAFALCYLCHDRDGTNGILSDRSFLHQKHLNQDVSCAACHDPHGISSAQGTLTNNAHLINFDTSIVFPDPNTGRLEYVSTGTFSGECWLTCHGEDHSGENYSR